MWQPRKVIAFAPIIFCAMCDAAYSQDDVKIPPRAPYQHHFTIEDETDKFDGHSTTSLKPFHVTKDLEISASFTRTTPDAAVHTIGLSIISGTERWKYLDHRPLKFLIDDKSLDLGTPSHHGTVLTGSVLEHMHVDISVKKFMQIVTGKRVDGRIGITEFALLDTHLAALRDLASRLPGRDVDPQLGKVIEGGDWEVIADAVSWFQIYEEVVAWAAKERRLDLKGRRPSKDTFAVTVDRVPAKIAWEAWDIDSPRKLDVVGTARAPKTFQISITPPGAKQSRGLIAFGERKETGEVQLTEAGEYKFRATGRVGFSRVRVLQTTKE